MRAQAFVCFIAVVLGAGCSTSNSRPAVRGPAQASVGKSGFFTTSDGVKLHYLEAGQGVALVFIPGWTMPAEIWEEQIRYFSHRYRVIALDPRCQGASGQTTEGLHPQRRAEDIFELVQQLRLAPAVLVGWSLGVSEVLTYVQQFGTETIRGLVLVDGFIGKDPDPNPGPRANDWLIDLQKNRKSFTQRFVRGMFRRRYPESYYDRIVQASLKTPSSTAFTLIGNYYVTDVDHRQVLQQIEVPSLFVASTQAGQAEMIKEIAPEVRVEVFANAGHALFVDEPRQFNSLLNEFLFGLLARRSP